MTTPVSFRPRRDLLQRQGADIVGVGSSGDDAVRLARELEPDCVLLDIELGPESGFDVATRLANEDQQRVVLISVHSEAEFFDLIAGAPVVGFIPKADLSVHKITEVLNRAGPRAS